MALKNKISTALLSNTGKVRTNNEDAVAEAPDIGLIVLADGMGGYNAGEIASGIATATVLDISQREWKSLKHGEIDPESGYSVEALMLKRAVEAAHASIFQVSQSQPQCAGMGTTVVACILHEDILSIAYVGDSRLYRFRDGRLELVTRDHSLLEELIARGHYTRAEAANLVRKNIVTRALGVEETVAVDLIEDTLEVGDLLLLCSDGLNDMVDDEIIGLTLNKYADNVDRAAKELVRLALDNGGKDNVSVALARVDASLTHGRRWYERLMEWF
jgi:serine/threonine protein phosphatase PrpC